MVGDYNVRFIGQPSESGEHGVNVYTTWLLPRLLDLVMQQKQMVPFRARIGAAATGRTLDVGIGSGLSLVFYGELTEQVVGVDPSAELLHFAHDRARKYPSLLSSYSAPLNPCRLRTGV